MGREDSHNGPAHDGVPEAPHRGTAQVRPSSSGSGTTYGRAAVPTGVASVPAPDPLEPGQPAPGLPAVGLPADRPDADPQGPASADAGVAAAQPGTRRGGRTLLISVLSAVLALAVAVAVLVARPGPVDRWLAADPTPTPAAPSAVPEPSLTPVLQAAGTERPAPSAAGVRAAIGPLVRAPALGPRVNISVVDATTGQSLYAANPDTMTTPASTTKLVTAATVLAARGPAHRLSTRVVAGARRGEVVLVGGGDPTLAVDGTALFPGAARLDKLAAQVRKALGDVRPTRVSVDDSLFTGPATGPGWDSDIISPGGQAARIQALMTNAGRVRPVHNEVGGDPRFADPALAAGRAFAKLLGVATSTVVRGRAPAAPAAASASAPAPTGSAPPAAGTELGAVQSPPLVHVVDWMLEQSDNVVAEALGRQVALAAGKPASFAGAAEAMEAKVAELGLPAAESDVHDASGLSRRNAISPTLLTDLLKLAADGTRPELGALFGGLPVAGWSGTLRTRFVTPAPNRAGQGLVRAKTGTLRGVNTIAGVLVTADGRPLAFAILADRTPADSRAARAALDRIAARLVACGCR